MNKPEALPLDYASFLPDEVAALAYTQSLIPAIAKDAALIRKIEGAAQQIPTRHRLWNADARAMQFLAPDSVQLVVTSPPYWVLKEYQRTDGQLGYVVIRGIKGQARVNLTSNRAERVAGH